MEDRTIKLQCPTCNRRLKISSNSLAKSIVCPKCNGRFRIDSSGKEIESVPQDLFGPPTSEILSAPTIGSGDSFDDVAQVIESSQPASKGITSPGQQREINRQTEENEAGAVANSAVVEQWNQSKKITTQLDESLNRNGIGLTILAIGLAMLPIFASKVEGLSAILEYVPMVAVTLAFIAAFMMAFSLRRGSVGSIILSGIPFLLIVVVSLIAYIFFLPNNLTSDIGTLAEQKPTDMADNVTKKLLNKEPIINNVAERFAPPKKEAESTLRPVVPDNNPKDNPPVAVVPESQLRPSSSALGSSTPESTDSNELSNQLNNANRLNENLNKISTLRNRIIQRLTKSLVSRNRVMTGTNQMKNFEFSKLIGSESVYGSAVYANSPISGFDVVNHAPNPAAGIAQIVPILDEAEFSDSFMVPEGKHLLGINLKFNNQFIVGIQPIVGTPESTPELGDWMGTVNTNSSSARIETLLTDSKIHGFVIYRNQLNAIGIRLVQQKTTAPGRNR